jgi:hypothetical protein
MSAGQREMGDTGPVLHWVAHNVGLTGYRRVQAPIAGGIYDIEPRFEVKKRKGRFVFLGFEVRYVTLRGDPHGDNPDYAEDEDTRVIKTGVQTETEAKAIAQADFSSARRD